MCPLKESKEILNQLQFATAGDGIPTVYRGLPNRILATDDTFLMKINLFVFKCQGTIIN